jgi:hypothetical protein
MLTRRVSLHARKPDRVPRHHKVRRNRGPISLP